jgi:hypothetical protein
MRSLMLFGDVEVRNDVIHVVSGVVGGHPAVAKCGTRQCRRCRMWDVGLV